MWAYVKQSENYKKKLKWKEEEEEGERKKQLIYVAHERKKER